MDAGSEAADLMVREGLQIAEANVWDVTGALTLCGRYEKIITII